jgi:hypothetical protein
MSTMRNPPHLPPKLEQLQINKVAESHDYQVYGMKNAGTASPEPHPRNRIQ